jgi:hypothetical protein
MSKHIRAERARVKGRHILERKGPGTRAQLLETSPHEHRPRARLLKPSPQGHGLRARNFDGCLLCPTALGKRFFHLKRGLFFGFLDRSLYHHFSHKFSSKNCCNAAYLVVERVTLRVSQNNIYSEKNSFGPLCTQVMRCTRTTSRFCVGKQGAQTVQRRSATCAAHFFDRKRHLNCAAHAALASVGALHSFRLSVPCFLCSETELSVCSASIAYTLGSR